MSPEESCGNDTGPAPPQQLVAVNRTGVIVIEKGFSFKSAYLRRHTGIKKGLCCGSVQINSSV